MTIFINKVTYGRNPGKDLCDGDKPKDTFKPAGDVSCFDDSKSEIVANALKAECHGEYTCTYKVPTLQIGDACSGMRREVKVETLCGKNVGIQSMILVCVKLITNDLQLNVLNGTVILRMKIV